MRLKRGHFAGALAALAIAGVGAYVLPTGTEGWAPVTYGSSVSRPGDGLRSPGHVEAGSLTASPDEVLPAVVSPAAPARVVSTTVDEDGRPVVTVKEATTRSAAADLVRAAQRAENALGVEVDAVVEKLGAPGGTDRHRNLQWDLEIMRAPAAWSRSTGSGVTVAVIDSGVDAAHEDLIGQVRSGYDAISGTAGVSTDANGHGTHVAGTIAAGTGNGTGIAAVAPHATILPVKVLDASGRGYMSDVAEGIVWAADNGAQVINMSLGSASQVGAVTAAIQYARSKGVVVIAAAGNSRSSGSPTNYPAADEGVIAVAATDSAEAVAKYSNAGSYVDVAAPGSHIPSTYPKSLAASGYALLSGTSMAAPHVAATAALLLAAEPGAGPDRVESVLKATAVDLGAPGRDDDFGYGRIDAAAAVEAVAPVIATPPTVEPTPTEAPSSEPTATPTPSESSAPATMVVTADASTRKVGFGSAADTTFTVTADGAPWANGPASICVAPAGGSWSCSAVETTADGTYTDTRTATGAFRVRLVVTAGGVTSATTAYTVKAAVAAARTGEGTIVVDVTGAPDQTVTVQRSAKGRWDDVLAYPAVPTREVTGLVSGATYRIVVGGTPTVQGVTSGWVKA